MNACWRIICDRTAYAVLFQASDYLSQVLLNAGHGSLGHPFYLRLLCLGEHDGG